MVDVAVSVSIYNFGSVIRDMMTHSFGEGYGTRSDEEGFGGVYGGNDPIINPGHNVNHPGTVIQFLTCWLISHVTNYEFVCCYFS